MTKSQWPMAIIVFALLALAPIGQIGGLDCQAQDKPRWTLKFSLVAPRVTSPSIEYAVFDYDPVLKFRALVSEKRDSFRKQINQAPDSAQIEILRNAQIIRVWNSIIDEMQPNTLTLWHDRSRRFSMTSSGPPGPKWVACKTVTLKGEPRPVCWSQRAVVEYGKTVPVIFGEGNLLHLEPIYRRIMEAFDEKI